MIYKRVYIMGVDGAGNFFNKTPTPAIDRIMAKGAVTYAMTTSRPTISAQCWGSMFHGVDADRHRLNNSIAASLRYNNPRFPSFMKVIRDAVPDALLASFCCWKPINYGIVEDDIGVVKLEAEDELLTQKTCEYLEDNDPNVLFVHFDSVDHAGHRNGYDTVAHLSQITEVDRMIDRIYKKADDKGYTEDMLFIVTADHGGTPPDDRGRGSHGGDSDAEKICMLAATGKSVKKGVIGECNIKDIASIVLRAFGLEQPDTWTSLVPENFFTDVEGGGERPVEPGFEPPKARLHANIPTPENNIDLLNEITGGLKTYHTFDGDLKNSVGNGEFDYEGKLYYTEGYHGSGVTLNDARLFTDITFGTESFSLGCWLKMPPPPVGKILFSNISTDENGANTGFSVSLEKDSISIVLYGVESKKSKVSAPYPENEYDGWFHLLLSFDREYQKLTLYTDFEKIGEYRLSDKLTGFSLDGQSLTTQEGGVSLSLDELIVSSSAMTSEQVTSLGEYYGI